MKKKTGPNPAKKEVRLSCLKVTIVEFVKKKKKKIGSIYPWKKVLDSSVLRKKFSGPGNIPAPPCLFNGRSLRPVGRIVGPMPMGQWYERSRRTRPNGR